MSRRYKILMIISSLNPKLGGPSRTIIDNALSLINQGFDAHILTCDRSGSKFIKTTKIKIFNKGPSYLGSYGFNIKSFLWLLRNKSKYTAFTVHGVWQFGSFMARILLKNKYFLYLHGQIDPYFGGNFLKSTKKKIYWKITSIDSD